MAGGPKVLYKPMLTSADYRIVDVASLRAARLGRPYYKAHGNSLAAKNGLRYEKRVGKELEHMVKLGRLGKVEHNPWFTFVDKYGAGQCCPDFLIWDMPGDDGFVIIVEVKLTWIAEAPQKLYDLYQPVVSNALGVNVTSLVICRNTAPMAPQSHFSLREAIMSGSRLLQWPDNGRMIW
jgi:hypothetical protein